MEPRTIEFDQYLFIDDYTTTTLGVNNNEFSQIKATSAHFNGTLTFNIDNGLTFDTNASELNLPIIVCNNIDHWFQNIEFNNDNFQIRF